MPVYFAILCELIVDTVTYVFRIVLFFLHEIQSSVFFWYNHIRWNRTNVLNSFFCGHCTCSRFCRNLWRFLFVVTGLVFVSIATLLFVHFFFTPSSLPSELVSTLISFISDPHGTIVTFLTNKDCTFLFISFLSTGVWLVSFFMCKRLLASLFLYNICIFYDK